MLMLTVALGSVLHLRGRQPVTLNGVPEDGVKLWEEGASFLMLKKDSGEALKEYSQYKLEELLKVRTAVGYKSEIEQIAQAIKAKAKEKQPAPDKPAKPEKS